MRACLDVPDTRAMEIKTVGVVGAGEMGNGIAHVFALAGFETRLWDRNSEGLESAIATITRNLERQAARGVIGPDAPAETLARIASGTDLAAFSDCDLIVESVIEDEDVKRELFRELAGIARPEAVFTTNSSTISITRLASTTDRPERFMGMHFMNPAPVMQLVELIRGIATEEKTFQAMREVVESLGKTATTAEDFPAFIVNRVLLPMINEAVYILYEGVGSVDGIDKALRLGANHPMGPFQLADFIGLDTCLAIMNTLHDGLSDTKYRPCPLLVKYVEAGWLGRKTKRGFYDYRGEEPVPTR